jgi:hypothetical protein
LGEDHRVSAQAQRSQHQTPNPVPPCLCHCQRCPGRCGEKGLEEKQTSEAVRSGGG